jgi:hypothetical protein
LASSGSSGCRGGDSCLGGAALGAVLGIVGAITIDSALLAREEVPVEKRKATFVPVIAHDRVGIAGTF